MRKCLFWHAKGRSMANFYIISALDQNLADSESWPILRLLEEAKICISGNLSKNCFVWATQWSTFSELKRKFDHSLDRSWCEFLLIIKNHGPKNAPSGCSLGPKFFPLRLVTGQKKNEDLAVQYQDVHE